MELRLRLTWEAYLAMGGGDELVFSLPESDDTVSLSLDDAARERVNAWLLERVNAWLLERVPTAGGRH